MDWFPQTVMLLLCVVPTGCAKHVDETKQNSPVDLSSVAQAKSGERSPLQRTAASVPQVESVSPTYAVHEQVFPFGQGRQRVLAQGNEDAMPVLLLHGATFRAELWRDLGTLEVLANAGFYAISADNPRHGKTTNSGYSPREHLKRLIDLMHLDHPVVFGHSFSGSFVLPLIAAYPDSIAGAVLVAPVGIKEYERAVWGNPLPVLILWGEKDHLIPVANAIRLSKAFPNSEKVILKGAGHECYTRESTAAFHAALIHFLRRIKWKGADFK